MPGAGTNWSRLTTGPGRTWSISPRTPNSSEHGFQQLGVLAKRRLVERRRSRLGLGEHDELRQAEAGLSERQAGLDLPLLAVGGANVRLWRLYGQGGGGAFDARAGVRSGLHIHIRSRFRNVIGRRAPRLRRHIPRPGGDHRVRQARSRAGPAGADPGAKGQRQRADQRKDAAGDPARLVHRCAVDGAHRQLQQRIAHHSAQAGGQRPGRRRRGGGERGGQGDEADHRRDQPQSRSSSPLVAGGGEQFADPRMDHQQGDRRRGEPQALNRQIGHIGAQRPQKVAGRKGRGCVEAWVAERDRRPCRRRSRFRSGR